MATLIQSFLKAKNAVKKTLIDFNCANFSIENHVQLLENLEEVLNPIKDAVEALSRRDSNLLIADAIIETLFEQLSLTNNYYPEKLKKL